MVKTGQNVCQLFTLSSDYFSPLSDICSCFKHKLTPFSCTFQS